MTNPFKRTALPDEHQSGTKRRALMGPLSSTVKGKALALSQENPSAPYNKKSLFLCQMCSDPMPEGESFPINGCSHSFCKGCTANHIGIELQQNMLQIRCPARNCSGLLEPRNCRSILPAEVFARWENAMNLAMNKQWRTSPKCNIFVERNEGCSFMTCSCRCRDYFCYACGVEKASSSHGC